MNNVPKLRFKADDGSEFPEWEEKKIGELGEFIKGAPLSKSDISDTGTPFILYGELYTTYNEVAYDIKRKTEVIVDEKYRSKPGDVLIPTSGESAEEISTATCVMVPGVILAGDLNIFRSNILDGRIMSYILNYQVKWKIASIAQGKSIVHIQSKQLSEISVRYPLSKEEQQKIADFLSTIDEIIAKSRDEVEAWEKRKKGVIKKLFSQEVRFKADDGSEFPEWEEKRLGEVCKLHTLRKSGENYIGTENMLKDFSGVKFEKENEICIGNEYKVGDILMSNIRPYLKKTWLADRNGVCSTDVLVFRPAYINSVFLNYIISSDDFITCVMTGAKGTKMPRGDKKHILQIGLNIPSLPEQQKIADCLASLDEVIKKCKKELAAWEELKKGLLQQMFV